MNLKNSIIVALLAGISIFAMGCKNDCDKAADHVKDCLGGSGSTSSSDSGSCTGAVQCEAKCINAASCSDITMPSADSDYTKCVAACGT